jgi:hypothetical protein
MRYKTKRIIFQIARYFIYTFLLLLGYSIAAHRYYLPAFFEYYTGNLVRSNTQQYYQKYFGDGKGGTQGTFSIMNVVDFVVREPSYLYVSDILDTLSKGSSEVSSKVRDDSLSVSTHPAIIEWLKNPHGKFASVYEYESVRYISSFESFQNFIILDKNSKVIHSSGKITADYGTLKNNSDLMVYNNLISIPVKSANLVTGRIIASTLNNMSTSLSFHNTGFDISWLWIDQENKILSDNISNLVLKKWIQGDKYTGGNAGVSENFRILSRNISAKKLVLVYPVESVFYYTLKILLYLAVILLSLAFIYFWQKSNLFMLLKAKIQKIGQNKAVELLEKSNMVNQEFASLAVKYQNNMQSMKIQEIDRLRLISEHLTYLHKSANKHREEDIVEVRNLE